MHEIVCVCVVSYPQRQHPSLPSADYICLVALLGRPCSNTSGLRAQETCFVFCACSVVVAINAWPYI